MSPRVRVALIVAALAAAAAAAVVGVTLLTRTDAGEGQSVQAVGKARPGAPPLVLDLGVRADPEAAALRRAAGLYGRGRRAAAGRIFARYRSLQARVGAAFAGWPDGALATVEGLAREHPRSAFGQLHLGFALFWTGRNEDALAAWRTAARVGPDSPSAVRAGDLLHPDYQRGLPVFVPSFAPPAWVERLPAARRLATYAERARRGGVREKLLYGVVLQALERPVSAERQYAAAAALAPDDPEAQTAAAVGRFDKEHPERAFSVLGPLARRFPRAPTVRFHLGLLLLWHADVAPARTELQLARAEAPASPLGRAAARLLERLRAVGTE